MFEFGQISLAAEGNGQDRIQILNVGEQLVFADADGAGGRSGGAKAAESVIKMISQRASAFASQSDCQKLIAELDAAILSDQKAGETTAVVVVVSPNGMFGASVGDSAAWV